MADGRPARARRGREDLGDLELRKRVSVIVDRRAGRHDAVDVTDRGAGQLPHRQPELLAGRDDRDTMQVIVLDEREQTAANGTFEARPLADELTEHARADRADDRRPAHRLAADLLQDVDQRIGERAVILARCVRVLERCLALAAGDDTDRMGIAHRVDRIEGWAVRLAERCQVVVEAGVDGVRQRAWRRPLDPIAPAQLRGIAAIEDHRDVVGLRGELRLFDR